MTQIILFNKPYLVLSQFTSSQDKTLSDFIHIKNVYPVGRLDKTSEGLLILTDDGILQHELSHPKFNKEKHYWVQVEGKPSPDDLTSFKTGIELKDGITKPAKASVICEPNIWPRTPPIRERKTIATTWLNIILTEGRNRQIRRMTAAMGFPTLRLIRHRIGPWQLGSLKPGEYYTN
jgi:23S rRNA pseudouridine2457 synthase